MLSEQEQHVHHMHACRTTLASHACMQDYVHHMHACRTTCASHVCMQDYMCITSMHAGLHVHHMYACRTTCASHVCMQDYMCITCMHAGLHVHHMHAGLRVHHMHACRTTCTKLELGKPPLPLPAPCTNLSSTCTPRRVRQQRGKREGREGRARPLPTARMPPHQPQRRCHTALQASP